MKRSNGNVLKLNLDLKFMYSLLCKLVTLSKQTLWYNVSSKVTSVASGSIGIAHFSIPMNASYPIVQFINMDYYGSKGTMYS